MVLTSSPAGGAEVKASACNVGDLGSIPGSGRSPGEGNDNPLQYSCLRIPWTEEPGGLQSMGRKESDKTEQLHFHFLTSFPVILFNIVIYCESCF